MLAKKISSPAMAAAVVVEQRGRGGAGLMKKLAKRFRRFLGPCKGNGIGEVSRVGKGKGIGKYRCDVTMHGIRYRGPLRGDPVLARRDLQFLNEAPSRGEVKKRHRLLRFGAWVQEDEDPPSAGAAVAFWQNVATCNFGKSVLGMLRNLQAEELAVLTIGIRFRTRDA
jgi:hypothetical protein